MLEPSSSEGHPRQSTAGAPLPRWVRIVDRISSVLAVVALVTAWTGGFRGELLGVTISLRSVDRLQLILVLLVAFRHWRVPRPTILEPLRIFLERPSPETQAAEGRLFLAGSRPWPQRLGRAVGLVCVYTVLVAAMTWPQVAQLDSLPDEGDPLLSTWRIAWLAHQLPRDPWHLFDANIFYPERLTLTYSDSHVVPSLMAAPLIWLGVHQISVYNLLLLAGFVLSGVTVFLLVEALTGHPEAALVSGAIFAVYPFRFEHYPHLELQMTMWIPLLLLAVHRVFARGRPRDGLVAGGMFGLQALSSLYYGVFMTVYLLPVGGVLWVASRVRARALRALAFGAVVAAVIIAPVAAAYVANRSMVGERDAAEVAHYSATPRDYLHAHPRSALYGAMPSSQPHMPERELFPTIAPVALAMVGAWPPLSMARLAYAAALGLSFDASLGFNGQVYEWLYAYVPGFRGLRVPARFSILVGLTLAVLAGYGVARMTRRVRPVARWAIALAVLAIALFELRPNLQLNPMWPRPSPVYDILKGVPNVVLAEFPMQQAPIEAGMDFRYMYMSMFHWHALVNGVSGHAPASHAQLVERMKEFPSDASVEFLRQRGVTHVTVHELFCTPERYRSLVWGLDARPDVSLVTTREFGGGESRLYRLHARRNTFPPGQ